MICRKERAGDKPSFILEMYLLRDIFAFSGWDKGAWEVMRDDREMGGEFVVCVAKQR